MDLTQLTSFLGWCAVINIGILLLATVSLFALRGPIQGIHSKLMDIDKSALPGQYMSYLATYKVMTLIFNVVPYFALKLM